MGGNTVNANKSEFEKTGERFMNNLYLIVFYCFFKTISRQPLSVTVF